MHDEVRDALERHRLVPVIVLDDPDAARPLGDALTAGGLPTAEVTLRTPAALEVLQRMAADPALLVGAGTVLDVEQVDAAAQAGARFIVSPGFDPEVVRRAHEHGLLCIPGVATATELQAARRAGVELFKFFPAGALGGVRALRALAAPFPQARFVPTGGITADDLADYLALDAVTAVGGSFMVPSRALADGDVDEVTRRVADAVARVAAITGTSTTDPGA